jgi:Domain of unknown function (DUF5122) beta-propeller
MNQLYTRSKAAFFILFIVLCLPLSMHAQTFDVANNQYTFNNAVNAIVKDAAGNTYVGGAFTSVGLWSGNGAKLNTTTGQNDNTFAKVSGGQISAVVAIPGGGWYIGGTFTAVNGISRNRLARINADGTLHSFDPNMNSNVNALAVDASSNLYAGGAFTTVGGSTTRNRLCKFNSTGTLQSFDPNMNNPVRVLAVDASSNLYAGGSFSIIGGSTTRNRLCKFDNTGALQSFNHNINNFVNALAIDASSNLYAGGTFTTVGSITRNKLCKFDNTGTLQSFDPNMSNTVNALAVDASSLYAGGNFTAPSVAYAVFSAPVVLPVELLSFSGKNTEGGNHLTWETANEVNNKGFQVERQQATGDSWETLGFVAAKGKSANYTFTDDYRLSSVAYYRLRQIDNEGKETLSKVIAITQTGKGKGLVVYPNPVSNVLTVENTEGASFQILNLLGQQVLNHATSARFETSPTLIDV